MNALRKATLLATDLLVPLAVPLSGRERARRGMRSIVGARAERFWPENGQCSQPLFGYKNMVLLG